MSKLTISQFVEVGFKRYPTSMFKPSAICLLQKRVDDKFYLNVYPYNMDEVTEGKVKGMMFEAEVQFETEGDCFNVLLLSVTSPEQAISFMRKVFDKLGCSPTD